MKRYTLQSIGILTAVVFLITLLVKSETIQVWLLCGALLIWLVWMLSPAVCPWIAAALAHRKKAHKARSRLEKMARCQKAIGAGYSETEKVLLLHFSARITEFLQRQFPEAIWGWIQKDPLSFAINGGVAQIWLQNCDDNNQANVLLDRFGRLNLEVLRSSLLKKATKEEPVSDADSWYALRGQSEFQKLIAELNTKGFHSLQLTDQGEALVARADKEASAGCLERFPERKLWPKLVALLNKDGLKAQEQGERLLVKW